MANLLRSFSRMLAQATTVPPTPPSINDLLDAVQTLQHAIHEAKSFKALDDCTAQINGLLPAFRDVEPTVYWVPRLHKRVLLRRCELLATRYLSGE